MRLQLIIGGMLLLWVSFARADGRAASWLEVYDDDDNLNVISSQLAVRAEAAENLELSASYEVDVISAATADVISAASPRGYNEKRQGISLGASWDFSPGTTLQLRYLPSWEVDYHSQGLAASFTREWLDRRLTTRLAAHLALDQVGRSGSGETAFKDVNTMGLSLGLGWIASRHTVLQMTYEPQRNWGSLESPYRFVPILWSDGSQVVAPERLPTTRLRHALALGVRHALGEKWFLSANYRLYLDSWGIVSHTGEVEIQRAIGWDKFVLGANLRGYQQGTATFHKVSYTAMTGQLPGYRSADKMLTGSWSVLGGLRGEWKLGDLRWLSNMRITAKFDLYRQYFRNFPILRHRFSKVVALGASSEF